MNDKILYVDDDTNILAACQRTLGRKYKITTATCGAEGLECIGKDGPFAVVLSDMRMPEMDGIEFIRAARIVAPDTVCIMLTGNSDQETAMNAVNEGQIFRFLTKPCHQDVLGAALDAGLKQFRLVTAERELLQKTLTGSINVLADVLGLVSPKAFARGSRIKPIVKVLVAELDLNRPWQYEIAALLSQIGCIVLPPETIDKVFSNGSLTAEEEKMWASHPQHGRKLIEHIPRLEQSARMIERQLEPYDKACAPNEDTPAGAAVLGSQIIRAATDFDSYLTEGMGRQLAVESMMAKKGEYNPRLIEILKSAPMSAIDDALEARILDVTVWTIRAGMYAHEDIHSASGFLLVPKGNEITCPVIERLKNFANGVGVEQPIRVLAPQSPESRAA